MRIPLLPVLALTVAAGCADSAESAARYRIARVNGASLPYTLREEGPCQHWLLEGFLNFPGDRTYTSTFNIQIVCPDSTPRPVPDPGISGTVRSSNDTVYFVNSAGMNSGHGISNADSIVIQGRLHRLTYMRIRDE